MKKIDTCSSPGASRTSRASFFIWFLIKNIKKINDLKKYTFYIKQKHIDNFNIKYKKRKCLRLKFVFGHARLQLRYNLRFPVTNSHSRQYIYIYIYRFIIIIDLFLCIYFIYFNLFIHLYLFNYMYHRHCRAEISIMQQVLSRFSWCLGRLLYDASARWIHTMSPQAESTRWVTPYHESPC